VTCVVVGALLRLVWATHFGISFDEAFTAMAGRRSLGDMLSYLRDADSHPPLDALLRLPLARAGASDLLLRAPSLLFSVGALALFAWWMRVRGIAGVVSTAVFAASGFAVLYGGEARMYALLQLLGVASAVTAEAWLRSPRDAHAVVIGGIVLVGCLDHSSMFLLGAGLLAVAGFRIDRDAWRWRAGLAVGALVWAALWGGAFLIQAQGNHSSWILPTTPKSLVEGVTSMVTFTDGVTPLVALAIVGGAVLLARTDRLLFHVWWTCGALPIGLAAVLGLFTPFFLNRTLTLMMWAPIVAVGVSVDWLWQRWRTVGVVAVVLTMLLAVAGTIDLERGGWQYDLSVERIEAMARPGDVIAVAPIWYAPLVQWRVQARAPLGPSSPVHVAIPDTVAFRVGDAPPTGRVVFLEFGASRPDLSRFRPCARVWSFADSRVRCLESGS
jgi:hypothetical protein